MKRVEVSLGEGYARWSREYDGYQNPLVTVEEEPVRKLLGDLEGRVVLDAGCGTGRHAMWMHDRGAHVIGIDSSPAMLSLARAKLPDLDLRSGSLLAMDFAPGTFDVVLNALVAEHIEDLGAMFRGFARVLGPSGVLVVSAFHPFMILKGVPTHFADPSTGLEYVLPSHPHLVSTYVRALRSAGFRLDEMLEPLVDDAVIARFPNMEKHRGSPLALILRASPR